MTQVLKGAVESNVYYIMKSTLALAHKKGAKSDVEKSKRNTKREPVHV